jgi:hypothetical protein
MKRDLIFIAEQLLPLLEEKRLEMVARNRSIKAKGGEPAFKLLTAFVRKADEGTHLRPGSDPKPVAENGHPPSLVTPWRNGGIRLHVQGR